MLERGVCANACAAVLRSNSEVQPSHKRERHSRATRHRSKSRPRRTRADRWVRQTNARLAQFSVDEMHLTNQEYVKAFREYGEATAYAVWVERVYATLGNPPSGTKVPERKNAKGRVRATICKAPSQSQASQRSNDHDNRKLTHPTVSGSIKLMSALDRVRAPSSPTSSPETLHDASAEAATGIREATPPIRVHCNSEV